MFGKKAQQTFPLPVRGDLLAAAEMVPRDAPHRDHLPDITRVLDRVLDEDETVQAVLRGNVSPSITWVIATRTLVHIQLSLRKDIEYLSMPLESTHRIAIEKVMSGTKLHLVLTDGSAAPAMVVSREQNAFRFAAAHRHATRPQLCALVEQTTFDCHIPLSVLAGAATWSPDLITGNSYEVGFSPSCAVIADAVGPLAATSQQDVLALEITGPQQVSHASQIETRVVLTTTDGAVVLVNREVLPQELHAHLLPQIHRLRSGPTHASPAPTSLADELDRLAGLHAAGQLSDREFTAAKQRLLG